jgi:hypothetical protein
MHNREYKKNCKHTIQIDVNSNQDNTMKWNQSILILIPVLLYMGSIATTICLYNPTIFVLLCSLSLQLTMRTDTMIQARVSFTSFPSYCSKLSNRIKSYNYFTFITIKCLHIRQMRAMLKICVTISKHLNAITSPNYYINVSSFKFKTFSKCALVHIQLSSTCACFVGLLTMLLHHTPLAEKFMNSCS